MKIELNEEDVIFLQQLQNELKTQETDSQASPRFWGIGDYKMEMCPEGCEDEYYLITEDLKITFDDFFEKMKTCDSISDLAREEIEVIESDVSGLEWVHKYYDKNAYIVPMEEKHFIHSNTIFLTKKEAQNHLKLNHYHYSEEAHTYGQTFFRSPNIERILKIIENLKFK